MKKTLNFAAATDIGRKRSHNEDYYILPVEDEKRELTRKKIEQKGHLFVLCDGMGGANAGEVASELSAGWTVRDFYNDDSSLNALEKLKKIISNISSKIYSLGIEHEQYKGMGTTIVAVHIEGCVFSICSIGDSRAYLLRDKNLGQLTEDHSQVWELYRAGSITKEELRHHPRNNVITLAIGGEEKIEEYEMFSCSGEMKKNDILMLCSDGLSDMVSEPDIKELLLSSSSLEKKCKKLVDKANEEGGKDNITIILIEQE